MCIAPISRRRPSAPFTWLRAILHILPDPWLVLLVAFTLGTGYALWTLPTELAENGRLALIVMVLAVVGWTMTRIPDSVVAIACALLLVGLGVLREDDLYAALGSELVWLLMAAFVMAGVLKSSGLLERCVMAAIRPFSTVTGLFYGLAMVIALTAFFVPSTSARAALLLPIFIALADRMPDPRLVRPLALLFPTVILLSAGGSLIGAGAHFIAIDTIQRTTGQSIGYFEWIALAFPFSTLSSLAAVWLIIHLFIPGNLAGAPIAREERVTRPFSPRQKGIAGVVLCVIAAWITMPIHGFGIAVIAIAGAIVLLSGAFTDMKPKEVFRNVETELILFLTATVIIADAMTTSGAANWLAAGAMAVLPEAMTGSTPFIVAVTAAVALLAHVAINSRSARAAVLIPAFALPLAEFGHDVQLLVIVTVLGTGFCQTMMAGAKPVAVFGNIDRETFGQKDLIRLAGPLLPVMFALLVGFALFIWPSQMARTSASAIATIQSSPFQTLQRQSTSNDWTLAIEPPKAAPVPGALCTRDELRTVMMAEIGTHKMWASGWWHVWDRLARQGIPVEKPAVKALYRGEDMVRLRGHNLSLNSVMGDTAGVAAARKACSGITPDKS